MRLEQIAQWGTGRETNLQVLYARWAAARGRRLPALGPFEREWIVDASADDPQFFRLPNHAGFYADQWKSRYLVDFPLKQHAARCGIEYLAAKEAGEPACHYLNQRIGGTTREYLRLFLPLAGSHLVYATRILTLQSPPSLVGSA